jgi:predicted phosphoribosyltransferase
VAEALHADLDVCVVRKIGVPGHTELAMGAVGPGDVTVVNDEVVAGLGIDAETFAEARQQAQAERAARLRAYRDGGVDLDVDGRAVVVVDDGLATGATMRAAVKALVHLGVASVDVAVPVGARSTVAALAGEPGVRRVHCVITPDDFGAVGRYYEHFGATSDDEVRALLARARAR